jgi:hypothetical protein
MTPNEYALGTESATGQLPAGSHTSWDITPDGKEIFFSKVDRAGSDLMLVENFR